jgi:magnesium transporter
MPPTSPPTPARRDIAADHIEPALLQASPDDTAAALRERIRASGLPAGDTICVVDQGGRLLGLLSPGDLLAAADSARAGELARRDLPRVLPDTDREQMVSLALQHGLTAVPVVTDEGRLLGVAGAATLMEILRWEHVEDLHRLAGITREDGRAVRALEEPPLRRARHRLPWLLVGFAGSVLATFIVARFESTLAALPAIAFFVPGLVYLADAIGTQSEAVAVRGLSLSRVGVARLLGGELRTGLLIGLVLAAAAWPLVWLAFGDAALAAAVALALAGASALASTLGLMLPWALARLGTDPAYGSGPLATILQDMLTLLIYFGCVSALLL